MSFVKNLNTPLLWLADNEFWTLEDACAGVHVFGGIGSGKLLAPVKCSPEPICELVSGA